MSKIAVIVGSIGRDSLNRRLAGALAKLASPNAEYMLQQIDDLPLFGRPASTTCRPSRTMRPRRALHSNSPTRRPIAAISAAASPSATK